MSALLDRSSHATPTLAPKWSEPEKKQRSISHEVAACSQVRYQLEVTVSMVVTSNQMRTFSINDITNITDTPRKHQCTTEAIATVQCSAVRCGELALTYRTRYQTSHYVTRAQISSTKK